MSDSQILNSVTVPLAGINLVEAAAGTGKTYNIQNLVARLILEQSLAIEEIVVLSFTNEAAAELGKRIRNVLDDMAAVLEDIPPADPAQALSLLDHDREIHPERQDPERLKLIRTALRDFDLANISTINGFCQKLLSRFAFESNLTFNAALESDPQRIVVELLEDWMRNKFYGGDLQQGALISALISQSEIAGLKNYILDFNLTIPESPVVDLKTELDKLIGIDEKLSEISGFSEDMFNKRSKCRRYLKKFTGAIADRDYVTILELADVFSPEAVISAALKSYNGEVTAAVERTFFFRQCVNVAEARTYAVANLKSEAIRFVRRRFAELERKGNFMTFSDQIRLVDEALQSSSGLKTKLQEKFKAGIIDEFQDTDAMQYRIFRELFDRPECCVFLVGDPRQAIYRFRGGDINAYLRAKSEISRSGNVYRLSTNYRSSVKMVSAVNAVFAHRDKPFGNVDIDFPELAARPPEKAPELLCNALPAERALIRHYSTHGNFARLYSACVCRIGQLISPDSVEQLPDASPITAGDIAVLMRSNAECVQMQSLLESCNIPAVCLKSGDVYADMEAYALYQVLHAALTPDDHKKVSTALAGFLCGVPLAELDVQTGRGSAKFTAYLEIFRKMNQLWYQQSFAAMFEYFLNAFNVRETLASRSDGERRLTNLLHLGELLHVDSDSSRMPPVVLTENFGDLIARSSDPLYHDEEHEELMSSSDSAVRIMTIHASKGLQFPVVMLPGLQRLTVSAGKLDGVFFNGESRELNLTGDPDKKFNESREVLEEKIRLIYVALTRAEYRCETFESAEVPDSVWSNMIIPLLQELPSVPLDSDQPCPMPQVKELELLEEIPEIADIYPKWQLISYSALTRDVSAKVPGDGATPVDHDEKREAQIPEKTVEKSGFSPFTLPGGAGFGTALHEIFERVDFAGTEPDFLAPALTLLKRSGNQELCRSPGYPEAVASWLYGIFHSPLTDADGEDFTLSMIPEKDRVVEMEFYCDIKAFDLRKLQIVLEEYIAQEIGQVKWPENWDKLFDGGILNGFIDLVFRRNGKYYIVDWKSNILSGKVENFLPEKLPDAMGHSFYFLQYLFYQAALVRYLRHCNNGVFGESEYEKMAGGIYYLFVRGVDPRYPQRGVFRNRPPWQVIQALEELICSQMK